MMQKIVFAIALLFLLATIGYCEEQLFQLTIKSDKQVYKVGDKVEFTLTIKNNSKINKYFCIPDVNKQWESSSFKIVDKYGSVQSNSYTSSEDYSYGKEAFKLVKPGMDYSWVIKAKLSKRIKPIIVFRNSEIELSDFGKFNISVNHEGYESHKKMTFDWDKEAIFVGMLISNTIPIEVI